MKIKYLIILIILAFPINVYAARGCCSHHGGIAYCGDYGYYICNDGTESPTCTCSYVSLDDDIELTDTSCNCYYDYYKNQISVLEDKIETLNDEKEELENKAGYEEYFYFLLIGVIIYAFYRIYIANKN